MERSKVHQIVSEISSYNPNTAFFTKIEAGNNRLSLVSRIGSVTKEQEELAERYEKEIIEYLSTPPMQKGTCRNDHTVEWCCTIYGVWVCKCYYARYRQAKRDLRNYWAEDTYDITRHV